MSIKQIRISIELDCHLDEGQDPLSLVTAATNAAYDSLSLAGSSPDVHYANYRPIRWLVDEVAAKCFITAAVAIELLDARRVRVNGRQVHSLMMVKDGDVIAVLHTELGEVWTVNLK